MRLIFLTPYPHYIKTEFTRDPTEFYYNLSRLEKETKEL